MADVYFNNKNYDSKSIIFLIVVVILIIGIGFGIYNYQKNVASKKEPKVEISKPSDNQEVSEGQIVLEGKTDPGSKVVISGKEVKVDSKGNYASEIALAEGVNVIKIETTGKNGKTATVEKRVIRVVPAPIATPDVTDAPATASYNGSLNNSGPENFWLPEASMLAAAGTAFMASKHRIKRVAKKRS